MSEEIKMERVALIMAGGSGTRFWPLSTTSRPKQFLDLVSEKTMIRETVDRISRIVPSEKIFIATNISYFEIIKKELPEISEKNIIFEPMARDTAACIGYAAEIIKKFYEDSVMAVLPSDHLIRKEEEFLNYLEFAFEKAEKDRIITLGIKPSYPETGYGYIEYIDKKKNHHDEMEIYKVKRFREKPNKELAERYIEQGNYLWNSGMFVWKSEFILHEIKKYMETHKIVLEEIEDLLGKIDLNEIYGKKLSDYVSNVFEKFEKISIDENNNIIKSEKYEEIESEGNIIINKENKKIIATIGLEDIVIVNTEDALLVCHKDKSQEIKKILDKIEKK